MPRAQRACGVSAFRKAKIADACASALRHFCAAHMQRAHMWIFAAQVLSKAFRNRFLELHVGDIPDDELVTILQHRCQVRTPWRSCMHVLYTDARFAWA